MEIIAEDTKLGLGTAVSIALSAFDRRDISKIQRIRNKTRIDEILGFTNQNINDSLIEELMLMYDHFELINLRISHYFEAKKQTINSFGTPALTVANEQYKGISEDIVYQTSWDLVNLVSNYNKIDKELFRFGKNTKSKLDNSIINNYFSTLVGPSSMKSEHKKLFFFTDQELERFNNMIGYKFKF